MTVAAYIPGVLFAGRFEIEAVAGSGGMGTVLRARDLVAGGLVALKLLRRELIDASEGERFAREAQLLGALHHPGIVTYIAHGRSSDSSPYLAMEWLEGEDLAQRLRRGPLSLSACYTLLAHVAEALAVAHARGIIHRVLFPPSRNPAQAFQKTPSSS